MPEPSGLGPGLVDRLLSFWRSVGVPDRPGALPEAIADFEARHGVTLSPGLRDYFLAVDGMDPDRRDDLFFRFLPLVECSPVDIGGTPTTFVVAEHPIGGLSYVVWLGEVARSVDLVFLWDGIDVWSIADTFAKFLELYLDEPGKLFPAGEPTRVG